MTVCAAIARADFSFAGTSLVGAGDAAASVALTEVLGVQCDRLLARVIRRSHDIRDVHIPDRLIETCDQGSLTESYGRSRGPCSLLRAARSAPVMPARIAGR
jgi:hypothetical protein